MEEKIEIKKSLFTKNLLSFTAALIDDSPKLMIIYQNPIFQEPDFKEYIKNRAENVRTVNHPQIVEMGRGEYKGFAYLSLPYNFGRSQNKSIEELKEGFKGKPEIILRVLKNVVSTIYKFHISDVALGNIAPSLFLTDDSGITYYTDIFNGWENLEFYKKIAVFYKEELKFLSLEHLNDGEIGKASDIYSLALMIIYLLSGKTYSKDDVLANTIELPPEVSDLEKLLTRMLDPDPAKRPGIELVNKAFLTGKYPVNFTYYDENKLADAVCSRCKRHIHSQDGQKVGQNLICKECVEVMSGNIKGTQEVKNTVAKCEFHEARNAVNKCHQCGKNICEDCSTLIESDIFCPSCAYDERKRVEREKMKRSMEENKKKQEEAKKVQEERAKREAERKKQEEEAIRARTDFDDAPATVTEDISSNRLIKEGKAKKKKMPLYIIIPAAAVVILLIIIIASGKKSYENKEIATLRKQFNKETVLDKRVSLGLKLSKEYFKVTEDPQHFQKTLSVLDSLLAIKSVNPLMRKRIYDEKIFYYTEKNDHQSVQAIYEEMKKVFKGDTNTYPLVLMSEANYYITMKNYKKAQELLRKIMTEYQDTPFGKRAFEEYRKIMKK